MTFAALETAPAVLLVALEPEEESPILFLRLRKAARKRSVPVFSVAPLAGRGLEKMFGTLIAAGPGDEVAVLTGLAGDLLASDGMPDAAERNRLGMLLRTPGAVVLVGERAAQTPGLLTAVAALADATGAGLAWVPRRAGERGALDAGALGIVLPGGRPLADPAARAEVEAAWGVSIPTTPGRDTAGILAAVAPPVSEDEEPVEVQDGSARPGRPAGRRGGDHRPARPGRGAGRGGRRRVRGQPGDRGPAPSPSWPTWCSRSPPRRRSPAPT